MATSQQPFEEWLCAKLLSLDPEIDTDVFVMYINGILDTDDPSDEKKESMSEILSEVFPDNFSDVCAEVYNKYEEINGLAASKDDSDSENLAKQLSNMLENQKIESVKPKENLSKEEKERKAAILAQYGHVSDEEDDDRPDDPGGDSQDSSLLQKNVNAESVANLEKEKREKSKIESDKKKEKDKTDREAQKQKQTDRKESEKKRTQKGERRR
ncbi:coiled-coil domain-containing protein 43-like [Mytilus edulis]|uniref:coiled-coil domain-containing protein 43-like n=1 Tax=Mytilus trossulus TaxID=6551 RepID=UPI003003F4E3